MSVVPLPPSATRRFAVPPEPVLPLTVEQCHAMIRSGALESGDPIELLEGWLVNKMIKNRFQNGDWLPATGENTKANQRW